MALVYEACRRFFVNNTLLTTTQKTTTKKQCCEYLQANHNELKPKVSCA